MTEIVHKTFKEYIQHVIDTVGTDIAVARFLRFTDGSRVGTWRQGKGRPDELNCIKLARWVGDDPLAVLRLAGYDEMAGLLKGSVGPAPVEFAVLRPQLIGLSESIAAVLSTMTKLGDIR
jgi:hypothetical protein